MSRKINRFRLQQIYIYIFLAYMSEMVKSYQMKLAV